MRDVRLEPVMDAGHPVYRLTDMDGISMRQGLFADRDAADRHALGLGWRIVRGPEPARPVMVSAPVERPRQAALMNTDPEGG